ncbi:MAG TPA: EAL domain-containing protein [Lysobacter sp.]|nr:EAL domain-containing protein [Lysobacter sp.]
MVELGNQVDVRQSARAHAATVFGVVVGLGLLVLMAMTLAIDRSTRLEAAERELTATAIGANRLVWVELRNLQRALTGIAADARHWPAADGISPALVESMRGVASRQPEFESLLLVDARGRALGEGRSDPTLPSWLRSGAAHSMSIGPLQRAGNGNARVLPMAVPMGDGRLVLARLHVETLDSLLAGLAPAPRAVSVQDASGREVAGVHGSGVGARNAVDRSQRVIVERAVDGYPLRVVVSRSRASVLQGWWTWVMVAVLLQLLYWLGLAYLRGLMRTQAHARSQLAARLSDTAQGLRLAHELGRTGTWNADRERIFGFSTHIGTLFGIPPERDSVPIEELYERMHPDDRERVLQAFADAWETGNPFEIDYRMQDPAGHMHWLAARGACVREGSGSSSHMRGTLVDITDRMQVVQQLREAEQRFRLLFDRNPLPFWVFDRETLRFLEVNARAEEHYGYTREEFLSMTILDIRPVEDRETILAILRGGEAKNGEVTRHRRKDGSELEVRVYWSDIEFEGRGARLVLAEDVTQRLAWQRELAWRANHDTRTGLLNADAVTEALQARNATSYGVAYVQLRGLELIEDSLGLHAGETMLRAIAARMETLGVEYGLAGHVRGDELVLVVFDVARFTTAVRALREALAQPVGGRDSMQQLESWLGMAEAPEAGDNPAQVIANAGLAAHTARGEGVPALRFESRMAQGATDRLRMAGRLHRAIDAGELTLYYQPLRNTSDGEPAALEALLRWPLPEGGFVPTMDFIRIAEDTGLIVPLGRWVLREAAATHQRLAEAGVAVPIAVNVSLAQCLHADLVGEVQATLRDFGLERGALQVELTESILMTRPEELAAMLMRLRMLGVCVALDDFGTGFSSMSYLRHLPLDKLKIDRAFITNVDTDPRSASICESMLALGHGLGLAVVAEGVERQGQFDWLAAHGCEQVQGFGVHMPMPREKLLDVLRGLPGDVAGVSGRGWPRSRTRAHGAE